MDVCQLHLFGQGHPRTPRSRAAGAPPVSDGAACAQVQPSGGAIMLPRHHPVAGSSLPSLQREDATVLENTARQLVSHDTVKRPRRQRLGESCTANTCVSIGSQAPRRICRCAERTANTRRCDWYERALEQRVLSRTRTRNMCLFLYSLNLAPATERHARGARVRAYTSEPERTQQDASADA
jgi:hypothetical protein